MSCIHANCGTKLIPLISGFSNIPWALLGELFPTNVKGLAAGVSTTVCSISSFLSTNLFTDIVDIVGIDSAFGIFALFSLISIFFVIFHVPETNGLSLAEIQELLNDPDYSRNTKIKKNEEILTNELKRLE